MSQHKTILLPCLPRILKPAKGLMIRGELHETENYTDPETGKELTAYSMGVYREDVPYFFDRSREMGYRVCMYAFEQPAKHEQDAIGKLINTGLLDEFKVVEKRAELNDILNAFNISSFNATIVVDEQNKPAQSWQKDPIASQTGKNIIAFLGDDTRYLREIDCQKTATLYELARFLNQNLYTKSQVFMEPGHFLYVGTGGHSIADDYISENIHSLQEYFEDNGHTFIYPPLIQQLEQLISEKVIESLRYQHPSLYGWKEEDLTSLIASFFADKTQGEIYDFMLQLLGLPHFKKPALLRLLNKADGNNAASFQVIPLDYDDPSEIKRVLNFLTPPFESRVYYREVSDSSDTSCREFGAESEPAYDADDHFGSESKEVSSELLGLIDRLKPTQYEALAKTALYIIKKIQEERPELVERLSPLLKKKTVPVETNELSRLVITRHNRFFLPDFGNVEIKMHALPRSVYLLFLRYPGGIRFKELCDYRDELLSIYQKETRRYDQKEIVKAVDDLVDMTKPSINQKCARIREAFRKVMNEDIARHYYIDGHNGEPKKIALPAHMIIIEQ